MPNLKISELPAATLPLTGAELVELVQGGVNVQTEADNLPGGGGGSGDDKLDSVITGSPQSGNYTVLAADLTVLNAGGTLEIAGNDTGDLTIPLNSAVAIGTGKWFTARGFANVVATPGVTITGTRGDLTIPSGLTVGLQKTNTDTWLLHNGTAGGGGGGGTWGSITGTLGDQTDLDTALDAKASLTGTETLTNKRITARVQSVTSSATVTPNADSDDAVKITAQAAGLTLANPSGTPTAMQTLVIRIKDNGTARGISYGSQYRALGITLPTTTVISKIIYLGLIWNADDSKWDVVGYNLEA